MTPVRHLSSATIDSVKFRRGSAKDLSSVLKIFANNQPCTLAESGVSISSTSICRVAPSSPDFDVPDVPLSEMARDSAATGERRAPWRRPETGVNGTINESSESYI